jgi:hypothetical protein
LDEKNKKIVEDMGELVDNPKENPLTPSDVKTVQQYWNAFGIDMIKEMNNNLFSMTENLALINRVGKSASYNPPTGEDYTRDINISVKEPTIESLKSWLKNPSMNSKALIGASQYMLNTIMQYKRITDYSAKMMIFNSELIPANTPKKGEIKTWDNGLDRCNDVLRKFKHRYEFGKVMKKVIEEGGMFTYVNRAPEIMSLVELPTEWCYITGRWDWGYTYAVDLNYFDQFRGLVNVTPEIVNYYKEFIAMRGAGATGSKLAQYQYYPVPVQDGYVFVFNPLRAELIPPYSATMIDGITILDFKNMLKQQMALDTVAIIAQIIPKDKEGKPIIDAVIAQKIVNATATILPKQTATFSTPFDIEKISFGGSQNQNNWIGTGEDMFWNTSGATNIMNGEINNAAAVKYSMINDFGFVDHMYHQCENFMNIQLWVASSTYRFNIKYSGNRYTLQEDIKDYTSRVAGANMPISKLYAMEGYEPYEVDPMIFMEKHKKRREVMPLVPASQAGGLSDNKGGAPKKAVSEMTDSGIKTSDRADNEMKVTV